MQQRCPITIPTLSMGALAACCSFVFPSRAIAQIKPDRTLPRPTVVRTVGSRQLIEQGTRAGRNLFHSFEQFSVPEGMTASFQNSPRIKNIVSRVTGQAPSKIQGVLGAQGPSNLYLLNPNGVLFGPNAQLRIGGSFLATTGDSLQFKDGRTFSAINPSSSTLLSVTAPIGIQFGRQAGDINVTGTGNQLVVNFPFIEAASPSKTLSVAPNQTFALIGRNISINGGNLEAGEGHLELGAVNSADRVNLLGQAGDIRGDYRAVRQFGNIRLQNAASLKTSGNGGGSITLQGSTVQLSDGSTLLARTLGTGQGNGITVRATKGLELQGFSADTVGPAFPTSVLTDVAVFATGQGGDVKIYTPNLRILDGAFISAGTFDRGNAGNLKVLSSQIELLGDGPFGSSGLFSDTFGPGTGGVVDLKTDSLLIADGAQISTSTLAGNPSGSGPGGRQRIVAQDILLLGGSANSGSSGLFANGETDQAGGSIQVKGDRLTVADGAQIATTSFRSGAAGDILLQVNQVQLEGTSPNGVSSGIFSNAEGTGNGGAIRLQGQNQARMQQLRLTTGAQLGSSTFGAGQAGTISVTARNVELLGSQTPPGGTTGILAAVEPQASGQGGAVTLNATQLHVLDGAQISVGTRGSGQAGNLEVKAQRIELAGGDRLGQSGLFVSALESTGASGNLTVNAKTVTLDDGATINASNFPSQAATISPGSGSAGNIKVQAQTIALNNQSEISAATVAGDRGNITLQSGLLQLSQGSQISTNAEGIATGGNINLNHDFIFAFGNSDITANAQQSFGGRILIQAKGIFGTEFRDQLTVASDITASSALGPDFRGVVQINAPDADPSDNLVTLPAGVVNQSQQIQNFCRQNAGNSFVVTQSNPLPDPALAPSTAVQAWLTHQQDQRPQSKISQPPPSNLPEAQGWTVTEGGRLKLTTTAIAPHRDNHLTKTCQAHPSQKISAKF